MPDSILERWDITAEELTEVVDQNPSLRGMILGYLAELKLEKLWLSRNQIAALTLHALFSHAPQTRQGIDLCPPAPCCSERLQDEKSPGTISSQK